MNNEGNNMRNKIEGQMVPMPVTDMGEFHLTKDGQRIICNDLAFVIVPVKDVEEFVSTYPDRFGVIYSNKLYVQEES